MKLNIRKLRSEDRSTLLDWWEDWGFKLVPSKDMLPEDGTGGVIVEDENGIGICSIFIYTSNSKLCHMSWPLSNKKFKDKKIKNKAFELIFSGVRSICNRHCGKYIIFYGEDKNFKFQERLKEQGFYKTNNNALSSLLLKI